METTFSDGIGSIAIGDNVVRIDFVSLSATEKDAEGNAIPVFRRRVIMPIQGFLKLFDHFEQTHQQMQKAGLIGTDQKSATPSGGQNRNESTRAPLVMPEVTSPNF